MTEQAAHPLSDAVKMRTSIKGQSLLAWDWQGESRWPRSSVQMPEAVVDLILKWRNEHQRQTQHDNLRLSFSSKQKRLAAKHGTPAQFAKSVYECVPGDISMDEARAAVEKYNREWAKASTSGVSRKTRPPASR